jgi:hypothetical protein
MTKTYWDEVVPTYIENWPVGVCALSIAQADIPLTIEEAKRLGANLIEYGECFDAKWYGPIDDIRDRVTRAVERFPFGAFIRLGSRSPKDSFLGYREGFKVEVGTDPLRFLVDASERIYEDLILAIQHNYAPHIFVREWVTIPRWAEFRCFMDHRTLVGISQYHYLGHECFSEITDDPEYIRWSINQFFPVFRKASHLDSVVFDVFIKTATRDNTRKTEVKLIEINPYFEMTDPCLFAWNDGFDGSFKYNQLPKEPYS